MNVVYPIVQVMVGADTAQDNRRISLHTALIRPDLPESRHQPVKITVGDDPAVLLFDIVAFST